MARGKKKSNKNYFTEEHQEAIVLYNSMLPCIERDNLFQEKIYYPLYKIAENLIHTYKFYYTEVEDLEDLKHEVVVFFLSKIDQYDASRGKAYSWFSWIGKNYLIVYNNKNYDKKKKKGDLEEVDNDSNILSSYDRQDKLELLSDFFDKYIDYCYKNIDKLFNDEDEKKAADSVLTLFKYRDNLEIFNKKALYIYIREMCNVDTPIITKVVKILKKKFDKLYNEYSATGLISSY